MPEVMDGELHWKMWDSFAELSDRVNLLIGQAMGLEVRVRLWSVVQTSSDHKIWSTISKLSVTACAIDLCPKIQLDISDAVRLGTPRTTRINIVHRRL